MRRPPRRLIRLLQAAYSGERAAALAYRGHARSVRRADERDALLRIEREEWAHREGVGRMLAALGARPARWREAAFGAIGRALGALCRWCGWRLPMAAAGRLEEANVAEYSAAAAQADVAGLPEMARELRAMSAVEGEHVEFFQTALRGERRAYPPESCDRNAASRRSNSASSGCAAASNASSSIAGGPAAIARA